ncbi:hypothetical protein AB1Y20_001235 [Prymnesium parvum]|uniref:J domain-containing protein n=1 Tax=Prymnesium parvum TaxID=97485 RepID=A0AB34KBZ1_PRYPA
MAYYRLAMLHHPDKSNEPNAQERFNEIGAAYRSILELPDGAEHEPHQPFHDPVDHTPPPFNEAFPTWAHKLQAYLHRIPERFDRWLMPSFSSTIYEHLKVGELAEALGVLEEMRMEGEQPSHAVYEMLIRGCAIAMRRPTPGRPADHLTINLIGKVLELWGDMLAIGRKPDYMTYIELLRALGKGGRVKDAMLVFEQMCGNHRLLPEQRAFDSMYELCVLSGHYKEALQVFEEQEEMRKSLWKPRYTPVSFSLLLTAAAERGPDVATRLHTLPRILELMQSHGIIPRPQTCERLLDSCIAAGELELGRRILALAPDAKIKIKPSLLAAVAEVSALGENDAATKAISPP